MKKPPVENYGPLRTWTNCSVSLPFGVPSPLRSDAVIRVGPNQYWVGGQTLLHLTYQFTCQTVTGVFSSAAKFRLRPYVASGIGVVEYAHSDR